MADWTLIRGHENNHYVYIYDGFSTTLLGSFDSGMSYCPCDGVVVQTPENNLVLTRDSTADKIRQYDGITNALLNQYVAPSADPRGLAFQPPNLILADNWPNPTRIKILVGVSGTVGSSFNAPVVACRSLSYDGSNLISASDNNRRVYFHQGVSAVIDSWWLCTGIPRGGVVWHASNLILSCLEDRGDGVKWYIDIRAGRTSTILQTIQLGSQSWGLDWGPAWQPSGSDTPADLECEAQTNPTGVTDQYPEFTAIYTHPYRIDGRWAQIQIASDAAFANILCDTGWVQIVPDVAHGNRNADISSTCEFPLYGRTYYWRIRFQDTSNNIGDWSTEIAHFTMSGSGLTKPDTLRLRQQSGGVWQAQQTNPSRVTWLTPGLEATFQHPDPTEKGNYLRIQVNTKADFSGTMMWDSGKQSPLPGGYPPSPGQFCGPQEYAGTALSHNFTRYYWRIKYWDTHDVEGPWSTETAYCVMASTPTAPTNLRTHERISGVLTMREVSPSSIKDNVPMFSAVFQDPDATETGTWQRFEFHKQADFSDAPFLQGIGSNVPISVGSRCSPFGFGSYSFPFNGKTYYWRIRAINSAGVTGPWGY